MIKNFLFGIVHIGQGVFGVIMSILAFILFLLFVSTFTMGLLTGCTLYNAGDSSKSIKQAIKDVIQETKMDSQFSGEITGEVGLTIDGRNVTGTLNARLKGKGEGRLTPPNKVDGAIPTVRESSMIIRLITLFQWLVVLIIFGNWVVTNFLGKVFVSVAKRSISVIVTVLILTGFVVFSSYNIFDLLGMGFAAWIFQAWMYDILAKKGYRELVGLKNK